MIWMLYYALIKRRWGVR